MYMTIYVSMLKRKRGYVMVESANAQAQAQGCRNKSTILAFPVPALEIKRIAIQLLACLFILSATAIYSVGKYYGIRQPGCENMQAGQVR